MAVSLGEVRIDYASVEELLHDPAGPIGRLILELSERGVAVAQGAVHVMPGTARSGHWGARSTAVRPPGTTKASIRVHPPQIGSRGGMFGGGDANLIPTVFLEHRPKGAVQMYDRYPFMTTGLDSLEGSL